MNQSTVVHGKIHELLDDVSDFTKCILSNLETHTITNQTEGNISSPNYGAGLPYPKNADLSWNVVVAEGYVSKYTLWMDS